MDDIEANPRTAAQRLQLVNEAIEEIMNIEGIKEGVFNKIKDNICI